MMGSWAIFGILSGFFAALVAIFSKLGVESLDSTVATLVRSFVSLLFLGLVVLGTDKVSLMKGIDGRSLLFLVLAGICGAISWLCYYFGLKVGLASRVTALDRLSIVFVVLMGVFIGEKLCWQTLVGALLLSLGAIIIALC